MRNLNLKKKNKIFLILYISLLIFSSLGAINTFYKPTNIESISLDNDTEDYLNTAETFIYNLNGKKYLAEYITREKVQEMKEQIEVRNPNKNYNQIIDGHGTGYALPSEEDMESLIGKVSLLGEVEKYDQKYRASKDISTENYFPTIGDQGMQGSCSAWANAYYAYGYLEAKDYGWDASSGNPDYLLSPAFAYNIIAAYDYGSIPYEVAQVLKEWGTPTLSAMPYNDMDVDSWGNEVSWRQAPYHRPLDYTLITYVGPTTIDLIKSLIDGGAPVTIGIDASQFSNGLDQGTMDFILSSGEYDPSYGLNHAQCFVGYDDAISEGSDVGAFRLANSWGESWMDGGYYWLTYDAFSEFADDSGQVIMVFTDRIDYNPSLIATWEFNPAPTRMVDIVTLGVGPHDTPYDLLTPHYDYDINNVFPDFMALDISEFLPYYTANNDEWFFLEIGSSDTTGTITSFLLERYVGGALQEISGESIDVPQYTPGYVYGTFMVFDHEIKVQLNVPNFPEIYNSYNIEAKIFNLGINDEININFDLFLNGISVCSTIISSLLSEANTIIPYSWIPTEYDEYNFTAYATPVPGETYLSNNIATKLLYVLGPVFFDDFETGVSKWDSVTGLWHLTNDSSSWPDSYHSPTHSMWFGDESTGNFDTGFREMGDITTMPIDLSLSQKAILEFYHWREGEGGGTYDGSFVYISIDGINWDLIYTSYDQFVLPWEKVSLDISNYAGNSLVQLRFFFDTVDDFINDFRGWLVDDVKVMADNLEIPHDLRVSLEVPEEVVISNTYTINTTVTNIGMNDETNIEFFLYLNGIEVNSIFISNLLVGASENLNYDWTPIEYMDYNFTAYAPPVIGEDITYNNHISRIIPLHEVKLFDGMFIDHIFTEYPYGSGPSRVSYSHISGTMFHVEWQGSVGPMLIQGYWDVDAFTRIVENIGGSSFGEYVHTPFWIFPDSSLGDIVPIAVDGEGDHDFNITGDFLYDLPGFGLVDVWELEDLTLPGEIAWYEKSTGILIYGNFSYLGGMYNYTFDFIDTNATFEYVIFAHDIAVYLDTPLSIKIDYSYIINATVKNIGLNDEIDVELFLYLDGLIIDSLTVPNLPVGASQTIQYSWTPTEYKAYYFKALAPAVPLESYLDNNNKTTIAYLIDTKLFDGLFIKHIFSAQGYVYNTNFTYAYYTGRLYHETWNIEYMGMTMAYSWIVDALTRVMSGGSYFVDGAHTPAWIFTNISLYEYIPIAADGEGDHNFYVARELIYNLPGFGPVEVWELEDLTQPGGIAWYEKSTGILLNGTFLYSGGAYEYTFDFVDTNADLKILGPPGDFILSSNAGTPDDNGAFDLSWTSADRALNYSVYQYSSNITEINGSLTLLGYGITDLSLALSSYTDGTYYFIVVAHNDYGDTLSNCIEVVVQIGTKPGDFILCSNAGTPDDNGAFDLSWTSAVGAVSYSVYQYSSYITEINGSLTLLGDGITDLSLALSGYTDGTYYFIAVAHNAYGDTPSNCVDVVVGIPPGDFILSSNAGTPDDNGAFDLSWTSAVGAVSYSVYQYSSYITEINGSLTLLGDGITDLSLALSGYTDGAYYFIAVAHNAYGDTQSNCIAVVVLTQGIPGYDIYLVSFAIFLLVGVISVITLRKKRKN